MTQFRNHESHPAEWMNDYLRDALPMVERIATRRASGQSLSFVERVISEALVGLWEERKKRPVPNLSAFLSRVVRCVCDRVGKSESKHRHVELREDDRVVSLRAYSTVDYEDLLTRMKKIMTEDQFEVLDLYVSGWKNKEIAEMRGTSAAASSKLLRKAMAAAQEFLEGLDPETDTTTSTS